MKTFPASLCSPCLLLMLSCAGEEAPTLFQGSLDAELIPTPFPRFTERLELLSSSEVARLGLPLGEEPVFQASWRIDQDDTLRVLLVEPLDGEPLIYADENLDGVLGQQERFAFEPVVDDPEVLGKVVVRLPSKDDVHRDYPVAVLLPKKSSLGAASKTRLLLRSGRVSAVGRVDIAGLQVMVRYDNLDRRSGQIDFRTGGLGMDADGDGRIRYGAYSEENDFAFGEEVVFRVGNFFVSTLAADSTTRRIALRSHHAEDYLRIVLQSGIKVPDFGFLDFEGRQRHLSDFRGKYLLLDFWGTWCSPCVEDFPKLKEGYEKYRHRGFEILGMDFDPHARSLPGAQALQEGLDRAKAILAKNGVSWTQARTESIHYLITKRFRISVFPTLILLDPEGVIVSFHPASDQLPLGSAGLLASLEEILPPA